MAAAQGDGAAGSLARLAAMARGPDQTTGIEVPDEPLDIWGRGKRRGTVSR
jgi:hypothetical protein